MNTLQVWNEMARNIAAANLIAPMLAFILGGVIAIIDLTRKNPSAQKYVFRVSFSYLYILVSAVGAAGVAYAMKVFGVGFSNDALLDNLLISLLGSGVFIGFSSLVGIPQTTRTELGPQLKTLRDFIYDYLESSIKRKLAQRLEDEIRRLHFNIIDRDAFQDEAQLILEGLGDDELSKDEKEMMSAEFYRYAGEGKYSMIIRKLARYRDIDFVIQRLSDEKILRDVWLDKLAEGPEVKTLLDRVANMVTQFSHLKPQLSQDIYYDVYSLVYHRLGEDAQQNGKLERAESYFRRALELSDKIQNQSRRAFCCGNLGQLALARKAWSEAAKWFMEQHAAAEQLALLYPLAQAKAGLARVHLSGKRPDLAKPMAAEALAIYERLNDTTQIAELKKLLSDATPMPA